MNKASLPAKFVVVLHRIFLALFYVVLRLTVGMYCIFRFKPRYCKPKEVGRLRPPFVVLADHVHIMDMFIYGVGFRPIIRWVAADANFRTPFTKFVMTILAGAVSKSKNRSDMVSLSRMQLLVQMGCVLGIFHEGERSWDGVGCPSVPGTDKLLHFLKIPVVYAHLEGAFLEHPRWSWSGNRNPVNVRYEVLIDGNEIADMPLSEISRRIARAGAYDEWAFQREARVVLKGNKRAEHLELVCFLCPSCLSVNTLSSRGNGFHCSACDCSGFVDEYGSIGWHKEAGRWPSNRPFVNVREWNLWQHEHYRGQVATIVADSNPRTRRDTLLWEDRETVILSRGRSGNRMTDFSIGSARFYGDRIEYSSPKIELAMPLESISAFSVFKQYYTEFYYDRMLHRFTFTNRSVSGYKWLMLFNLFTAAFKNQSQS